MALADPSSSDGEAPGLPKRSPRVARASEPPARASAGSPAAERPAPAPIPVAAAAEERDLSAGLRDPAHRLLGSALQDAVRELGAWWRAGADGGDEEAK